MQGIGVSDGIRVGKAFVLDPSTVRREAVRQSIAEAEIENELERLRHAKETSIRQLGELVERTRRMAGEEKAVILAGQQSILDDPAFYPEIEKWIVTERYSAERAVLQVVERISGLFAAMESEYLRERAVDVKDVGNRLLANLQGGHQTSLSDIGEPVILVADDLTPSETVQLDKRYILGFVIRKGGKTSHTAILSRSVGIPAVVGVGEQLDKIRNGSLLVIDGASGVCIVEPDAATLSQYQEKMRLEQEQQDQLKRDAGNPAVTQDGIRVEIAANIGTPEEARVALEQGAEGIGLYRTEFLFMHSDRMPDEEEQYRAYKQVAETMGERPVVIRTLDIGGDKQLPYLSLPQEMNPFLGYRAIRLCLGNETLLLTQIRAILRASAYGKLKIMFPMISGLEEWHRAKAIYEKARQQLEEAGIAYDRSLEVGIMIEVPSAALLADRFAREVDFFSIGTNDLVQYTLAVDRMNEHVAYLYDPFHPAVLRLIQSVIAAAHQAEKWVGMCGGMAGDPLAVPLLLGFGLDEWSMDAGSISRIKRQIARLRQAECKQLAAQVLELDTAEAIRGELQRFLHANSGQPN